MFRFSAARLNAMLQHGKQCHAYPQWVAAKPVNAAKEVIQSTVAPKDAYSKALSRLHWLTAPAMMGCVGCVLYKQQLPEGHADINTWMYYHVSFGLLTGLFAGPRLVARLSSNTPPALPAMIPGKEVLEHALSKVTHLGLYGFLTVMPATGIAMNYYGGRGTPLFSLFTIPPAAEPQGAISKQAFDLHTTIGTYGKFLIPTHVGAAGLHAVRGHSIFARVNPFACRVA